MEVTCSNFRDVLTELDEILDKATFLAIDGEFTGLNSGPEANAYDTPAQYYDKLRTGSMDFLLVQFGLSVFTYNSINDKYSQRSYNFYVFPRPFNRSTPDCRFMCQASCITFLANQDFDFNKLFKYGIPYLTKTEEDKLNKQLEEKQKMKDDGFDLIPIPDDDKPQIEEICSRIENFISAKDEELTIDRCNAFIRRLIYQEVKLRWPNQVRLESKNNNGNQSIIVFKVGSKEEEEKKEAERREKEKNDIQQAVGLSALLRKIADSGKLIVGHNMLLDLCHVINQFFGPLPESYTEFKSLVHCLFPRLLDTKVICQSEQFKDSVPSILNHLLETLHMPPFSIPEVEAIDNRSYSLENDKLHEAGYDAYITGLCFITLCNRLGSLQKPEISTVLADSPLLNPYLNKLLIARLKDYPYINLTGKDPNPSRDHVFHITFPKQWKTNDLTKLFSPYGGAFVSWLSDTTAYASLYKREQARAVVKNLFKSSQYSLEKYKDHQAHLENEKSVKIERKRKISENDATTKDSETKSSVDSESKSNSTTQEEDGWEVAPGNEHSKFTPNVNDNKVKARVSGTTRQTSTEEFRVVRKVRLKNGAHAARMKSHSNSGPAPLSFAGMTRYTILGNLDDDETTDAEFDDRPTTDESTRRSNWKKKDSSRTNKQSSKKGPGVLPLDKRKQRKRNFIANWLTRLRLLQIAGLLVLIYFLTLI